MVAGLAAVALLLSVTGCSGEASKADASSKPSTSAEAPTEVPSATPEANDWEACDSFANVLMPAQDVMDQLLADASGQTIDRAKLADVVSNFRKTEANASPALYIKVHPAADVFYVIDGLFAGTESNQTLDTGGYRDGIVSTLQYCTETVGYTKTTP